MTGVQTCALPISCRAVDDHGDGDGRVPGGGEADEGGNRAVLGEDLGGAGLACDEVAVASFFYNSCRCS